MHHIVIAMVGRWGCFSELSALYTAYREGEGDPLSELPVQYADYAAWQRQSVEGAVLQAQAEYWTKTLAGAPELFEIACRPPATGAIRLCGCTSSESRWTRS